MPARRTVAALATLTTIGLVGSAQAAWGAPRPAARGELNGPWGLAQVPAGFGTLTGKLLLGNFGDGRIGVYDPNENHFFGFLRGENGRPVQIERLWALLPGTATTGGTDAIWFSAGIGNKMHGLVGTFKAAP